MNKSIALAIMLTLGLTACANVTRVGPDGAAGFNGLLVKKPDPHAPNVFVIDDRYLVVDQDPIQRKPDEDNMIIVWALEASTRWIFDSPVGNAVAIVPVAPAKPIEPKCNYLDADRKTVACRYAVNGPGKYNYTLRAVDKGDPRNVLTSDPSIRN